MGRPTDGDRGCVERETELRHRNAETMAARTAEPKRAVERMTVERMTVERMTGIEPALSAWEAEVLPLNYIRAPELAAPPKA